jgi:hypothetical protein
VIGVKISELDLDKELEFNLSHASSRFTVFQYWTYFVVISFVLIDVIVVVFVCIADGVGETNGDDNGVEVVVNMPPPPLPIKDSSSRKNYFILFLSSFHSAFVSVNLLVVNVFRCCVFGFIALKKNI